MIIQIIFLLILVPSVLRAAEPPCKKRKTVEEVTLDNSNDNALEITGTRVETLKRICSRAILEATSCRRAAVNNQPGDDPCVLQVGSYQGNTLVIDPIIYHDILELKKERIRERARPTILDDSSTGLSCTFEKKITWIGFITPTVLGMGLDDFTIELGSCKMDCSHRALTGKEMFDVKNGIMLVQDRESKQFELHRLAHAQDKTLDLVATIPSDDTAVDSCAYLRSNNSEQFAISCTTSEPIDKQFRISEVPVESHTFTRVVHDPFIDPVMLDGPLILTDRYKAESSGECAEGSRKLHNHFILHNMVTRQETDYPDCLLIQAIRQQLKKALNAQDLAKTKITIKQGIIHENSLRILCEIITGDASTFGRYDVSTEHLAIIQKTKTETGKQRSWTYWQHDRILRVGGKFFDVDNPYQELFSFQGKT